jgi:hypothetical protein
MGREERMTEKQAKKMVARLDPVSWSVYADWCTDQGLNEGAEVWRRRSRLASAVFDWLEHPERMADQIPLDYGFYLRCDFTKKLLVLHLWRRQQTDELPNNLDCPLARWKWHCRNFQLLKEHVPQLMYGKLFLQEKRDERYMKNRLIDIADDVVPENYPMPLNEALLEKDE